MKKGRIKKIVLSVAGAVAVTAVFAGGITYAVLDKGPFEGTVTESSTGKPIANVAVTDGRNVVKTDENGNFKLKGWWKSHFVTVTVPSGYATDKFYIPVEKSRERYDFSLDVSELTAQEEHSFLQISDTEIGADGTGEWLDTVKDIVKEENPAFLIHTGDICYEDGLKRHIVDMNTETMGCTVRYTMGNHDFVKGKYGEELYESLYGPTMYSFDVGKVHYIVTSYWGWGDYASLYTKAERFRWLKNDLENVADDMSVVIFNHTMFPSDDYVVKSGLNKLDLKEHNLIAWCFGHYHYNYIDQKNGVMNISAPRPDCGGIDGSPAGTRVISVNGKGEISTEMRYYDLNATKAPENTLWSTKLDGRILFCDTLYEGEYIYTATVGDDYPSKCGVYCLNAKDGTVKWFYETKNSVKNNIKIDGDKLVAIDVEGNVYCLDKISGKLLWDKKLPLGNTLGTSIALCIDMGVVFTGSGRYVTALNIADGSEKWSVDRNSGENSPTEFLVMGSKLIVGSNWDALVALDVETGKELWANKDEDIRFRNSTPIQVDDKTLLVADSDAIMLVSLDNGEITYKMDEAGSLSSSGQPALRGGIAYIPQSDGGVVAFDISQKKILWNCEVGESILFTPEYTGKGAKTVESSPVIDGETLIFGANDGCIYSVDIKTGEVLKKYSAGSAVLGKVVVTEDKIYAGTFEGYMVAYTK
ncbi:MAG: PQQ-binding-like beta-propeller repeat protein [Candidatus Fimenecus sp.]